MIFNDIVPLRIVAAPQNPRRSQGAGHMIAINGTAGATDQFHPTG